MKNFKVITSEFYPSLASIEIPNEHTMGLIDVKIAKLMAAAPELLDVCELVLFIQTHIKPWEQP